MFSEPFFYMFFNLNTTFFILNNISNYSNKMPFTFFQLDYQKNITKYFKLYNVSLYYTKKKLPIIYKYFSNMYCCNS